MPKFDKPVFFTRKVAERWREFWAAMPDEEEIDLRTAFAESDAATPADMADWDWAAEGDGFASTYHEIPGYAFFASERPGFVTVITWQPTVGRVIGRSDNVRMVPKAKGGANPAAPVTAEPKPKPGDDLPPPVFLPIPVGLPYLEMWDWLSRERAVVSKLLFGLKGDGGLKAALEARRAALAEATDALNASENDGEADSLVERPDGTTARIVPCMRWLIRKVKELEAKVSGSGASE